MKEKLVGIGAVLSAALASVCCIGPLVLAGLGLGSLGAAGALTKYRPLFMAVTFAILGIAFYFVYRKREVQCKDGSCKVESGNKKSRVALWGVTLFALVFLGSHLWIGLLGHSKTLVAGEGEKIVLAVNGMHCSACAVSVEKSLQKVTGVKEVTVNFDKAEATLKVDKSSVKVEELVRAVESVGYKASLKQQ